MFGLGIAHSDRHCADSEALSGGLEKEQLSYVKNGALDQRAAECDALYH